MVKDIEKRRELENLVYGHYCPPYTLEEKMRLQREVGAAMDGYELGLREVLGYLSSGQTSERVQHLIRSRLM